MIKITHKNRSIVSVYRNYLISVSKVIIALYLPMDKQVQEKLLLWKEVGVIQHRE